MSGLTEMLATLAGDRPERLPYCPMGHWNQRALRKLLPGTCYDGNLYCLPETGFDSGPRTGKSRQTALNYARFMDVSTLGCGKGGALPFGHGGPGEIIGRLERREPPDVFVYRFEGGSTRVVRYNPYSVHYGHSMPIRTPEDLDSLELPDLDDPARWQDIAPDAARFEAEGFLPTGNIQGFFSGIHNSFYDFQSLMIDMLDHPEFVHRLTARLAGWSLKAAEKMLDRGVRMIAVCDDLGTAEGPLIAPEMFAGFYLGWYGKLCELCHGRKAFVHMHSHGNLGPILPMLIDAGVDILNPFDPRENPHLEELVARFGHRVVFCGMVPSDYYLRTDAEIEALFARAADLGRKARRGFVLMEHGFPEELDAQRFRFILGLIEKYRTLN